MSGVGFASIGAVGSYILQIGLVFGFVILPYVTSTIGFQLLQEKTSFHINKYLGLILGPIILIFIANILEPLMRDTSKYNTIGFTISIAIILFSIFLFILLLKILNNYFLGN